MICATCNINKVVKLLTYGNVIDEPICSSCYRIWNYNFQVKEAKMRDITTWDQLATIWTDKWLGFQAVLQWKPRFMMVDMSVYEVGGFSRHLIVGPFETEDAAFKYTLAEITK